MLQILVGIAPFVLLSPAHTHTYNYICIFTSLACNLTVVYCLRLLLAYVVARIDFPEIRF